MRPIKLEFVNVFQFHNAVYHYECGVTKIMAPNGSGKSNFADPGQFFAITGRTPEGMVRGDILNWHSTEGHTLFTFGHADVTYVLKRNVHNSTTSLRVVGEKKHKLSGSDVNVFMEEALGMSFDVFYEACWAPQGRLTDIITTTHARRAAFFQRICDGRQAEILRGVLQENGVNKLPEYPDRAGLIEELQANLGTLSESLGAMHIGLTQLRAVDQECQNLMPNARRILGLPTKAQHDEAVRRAQAAYTGVVQAKQSWLASQDMKDVPEVHPVPQGLLKEREMHEKFVRDSAALDSAEKDRGTIVAPVVVPEPDSVEYDQMLQVFQDGQDQYKLFTNDVCPTCNRTFEFTQSQEDRTAFVTMYEKLMGDLQVKREAVDKARRAHQAYLQNKAGYDSAIMYWDGQVAALTNAVGSNTAKEFDEEKYQTWCSDYATYCAYLQAKETHARQLARFESDILVSRADKDTAESDTFASDDAREQATAFMAQHSDILRRIEDAVKEQAAADARQQELVNNLQVYTQEQAQRDKSIELRRLFERSREILHRDNLPKIVLRKMLNGLNMLLLTYLDLFDTNFTAKVNADFDFEVTFDTKADVPARVLSGGQQVALAIAFRFALSDLLGSSLPMLVLDEPTVYLDEQNVRRVSEVLSRARSLTEKGVYVMVATHDPALTEFTREVDVTELSE